VITSLLHRLFLAELLNVSFDFFLLMGGINNIFFHTLMNIQSPSQLVRNGTLVYSRRSYPVFIPLFGVGHFFLEVSAGSKKVIQTFVRLMDADLIFLPIHCLLVEVVRVKEAPLPEHLIYPFGLLNPLFFIFCKSSSMIGLFHSTASLWIIA
jgi:hypothetical protein